MTILVGLLLLLVPTGLAWGHVGTHATVLGATGVCQHEANTCVGTIATINSPTVIANNAILNFNADGFPTVIVASGGTLETEDLTVTQAGGCPNNPSAKMTIKAGDLTIKDGGSVNGDISGSGHRIGGQIFIELTIVNTTTGSLIVEPGGRLTSDRLGAGNGRGGTVTVLAQGFIDVQATAGCPNDNPSSCRGIVSANALNSSSGFSFDQGCGVAEIALVARGDGAPPASVPPGNDVIDISGTVEILSGTARGVGGVIKMMAGAEAVNLTIPPFPSPNPINPPNPPVDPAAKVFVKPTGVVNTACSDPGGCQIIITACFVLIQGLVQAGGVAGATGDLAFGRETLLPVFIKVVANETIDVNEGGRILADLRTTAFKQHAGQGITNAAGLGTGCDFTLQSPPNANGPIEAQGKGGADICLIARAAITLDGTQLPADQFAVSARVLGGSQVGGTVLALSTEQDFITLLGNAITVDGPGVGGRGGLVAIQANEDVDVNGLVRANGGTGGAAFGGRIEIQAVNGDVRGTPGGELLATAANPGSITLRSCSPVTGFPPATSNPPATIIPDCDGPNLVNPVPTLIPCGIFCFCIERLRIQQGNLVTISGKGFGTTASPNVTRVDIQSANCDPGVGTSAAFVVVNDTTINLTPQVAVTSGTKVVISRFPDTTVSSSCLAVP